MKIIFFWGSFVQVLRQAFHRESIEKFYLIKHLWEMFWCYPWGPHLLKVFRTTFDGKPLIEKFSANGSKFDQRRRRCPGSCSLLDWQEQRPFVPVDQCYMPLRETLSTPSHIIFSINFCFWTVHYPDHTPHSCYGWKWKRRGFKWKYRYLGSRRSNKKIRKRIF